MHFSPLAAALVAYLACTVTGSPIPGEGTCPAPVVPKISPSALAGPAPSVPTPSPAPQPSAPVPVSSPVSSPIANQPPKPADSSAASPVPSAAAPVTPPTSPNANLLAGQATYYGGNLNGGACSFSGYTLPTGVYGTASSNWDDAGNCGACVAVTGPSGNKITAMIVDLCPNCGTNHLDLFPDAFAALANPIVGVISVTWEYVDCPVSGPISLRNKEGSSRYWFSMQVINAKVAVKSLEVSTDGGNTWQGTTRVDYNYFQNAAGFGTDTVNVRVTSVDGEVIVVNGVPVTSNLEVAASRNF